MASASGSLARRSVLFTSDTLPSITHPWCSSERFERECVGFVFILHANVWVCNTSCIFLLIASWNIFIFVSGLFFSESDVPYLLCVCLCVDCRCWASLRGASATCSPGRSTGASSRRKEESRLYACSYGWMESWARHCCQCLDRHKVTPRYCLPSHILICRRHLVSSMQRNVHSGSRRMWKSFSFLMWLWFLGFTPHILSCHQSHHSFSFLIIWHGRLRMQNSPITSASPRQN